MSVLTIIFSGIVALSTIVYAYYTYNLTTETITMRRAQTDAHIGVTVEPGPWANLVDMVLKNFGPGPAKDVRFTLSRDLVLEGNPVEKLSGVGVFRHGIPYWAPGQEYRFFLLNLLKHRDLLLAEPLTIMATYRTVNGEPGEVSCEIDFRLFEGMARPAETDMQAIGDSLKKMSDVIAGSQAGFGGGLRVVTETKRQRDAALDAFLKESQKDVPPSGEGHAEEKDVPSDPDSTAERVNNN
jgi:hypothetical protein